MVSSKKWDPKSFIENLNTIQKSVVKPWIVNAFRHNPKNWDLHPRYLPIGMVIQLYTSLWCSLNLISGRTHNIEISRLVKMPPHFSDVDKPIISIWWRVSFYSSGSITIIQPVIHHMVAYTNYIPNIYSPHIPLLLGTSYICLHCSSINPNYSLINIYHIIINGISGRISG